MKKVVLLAFLLAGCNETQIVSSYKYMVVHPDEAMYNCPVLKKFPNWQNLTDSQVADTILTLYKNNITCKSSIESIRKYLNDADKIIMHNGIFFDAPVLKKCWGITMKKSQVVDTLVMSRLYNPSLEDGHSLATWGQRLGHAKGDFNDFDGGLCDEMIKYCIQDTLVTKQLYNFLEKEMKHDYSKQSIDLEHEVAIIIAQQERNGFKFDERLASQLLSQLKTRMEAIQVEMASIFPPRIESGRVSKLGKPLKDIITPFNPGSRKQIAERLIEKGWKPKKHTEKGSVIVDETTLEGLDFPEAKAIAEYLMLQKRASMLESWLEKVGKDGRVHGKVITIGAVTNSYIIHTQSITRIASAIFML